MIHFQKEDFKKHMWQPNVLINLKLKMILLIGALAMAIVAVIGGFLHYFLSDAMETQIGEQALSVAQSVALIPELQRAFRSEDPAAMIQPIVQPITQTTDAQFIVVGNTEEIRYAHPNVERIGEKMVGEDNERALVYGESYVSVATGTLGKSLRAKVPVVLDGEIVGVVSVGFLAEDVRTMVWNYNKELWIVLFLIATAAILGAVWIASYIKNALFGLEPEEISHLLFQKETILHSTHEGVIAVNADGVITMMNSAAKRLLLGEDTEEESFIGRAIQSVVPASELPNVLATGSGVYDRERMFGNHIVYVNSVPIYFEQTLVGAVSTFRSKTEIEQLTKELTHIKQYANALRAQTHEFSNKLYTILGLIQLNKEEEAIKYIQDETNVQQQWIQTVMDNIRDPLISGLLIGKLNQASEQQIHFVIEPDSRLHVQLSDQKRQAVLTALGNLIDNAMDALHQQPADKRMISLFFTDVGRDVLFEIDDAGAGIPQQLEQKIFDQGVSTKDGTSRGFGLALTKQSIDQVGGEIYIEESQWGGACFVVSVPKDTEGV